MSNLNDAVGLRMQYGNMNGQFDTEYEPCSAAVWGYMHPKGNPCFSLALLKDIREHDAALEANGGVIWAENNADRGATFHFKLRVDKPTGRPVESTM